MIAPRILMATLALLGVSLVGCESSSPPPAAAPPSTAAPPATPTAVSPSPLAGTSWQLVKVSGSDGKTEEPDDRSKYTVTFQPDGSVVARVDCNRGRGAWKSAGPNQLELGPLALTRAMCPPGSMDARIAADWSTVRTYTLKDGHLFLSLMADGGTYEYEPVTAAPPS